VPSEERPYWDVDVDYEEYDRVKFRSKVEDVVVYGCAYTLASTVVVGIVTLLIVVAFMIG
jgi:hypothetical protein